MCQVFVYSFFCLFVLMWLLGALCHGHHQKVDFLSQGPFSGSLEYPPSLLPCRVSSSLIFNVFPCLATHTLFHLLSVAENSQHPSAKAPPITGQPFWVSCF